MHRVCTILILFVICNITLTRGEKLRWNGGSGYFNDASMWTPPQIPGPADDVWIVANGTYNVVLDTEVTTVLTNLNIGGTEQCVCKYSGRCEIYLYVHSPLNVTNTINILQFGVLVVVETQVSSSTFNAESGAIYGSGMIAAESHVLSSTTVAPGQIERLDDPTAPYVISSSIGLLHFVGDVHLEGSPFFFMHVIGNETIFETDKVVVDGAIIGNYSKIILAFLDTPIQYDIPFDLFSADNIGVTLWDVGGGSFENGSDIIAPANCLITPIGGDCKGCPMSGFGIILMTDTSACCPEVVPPNCPGEPDCNGLGECQRSIDPNGLPTCQCFDGWTGNACDIADCSSYGSCNYRGTCDAGGCQCSANFTGSSCTDPICSAKCREHGHCDAVDSQIYCSCNPGWEGPECDQPVPQGECSDDCNGRGQCQCAFGPCYCICNATYNGPSCAYPRCVSSCHNGQCVANDTASWCQCHPGWGGDTCTLRVCPSDCSGNGLCVSYGGVPQCNCQAPWTGADCSKTEEVYNGDENSKKDKSNSMPIAVGVSVAVAFVLVIGGIIAGVVILNRRKAQRKRVRDNIQSSITNSQL